ncbi:U11/U12 small nuclear ribonucleoprotein 59 kDa protein isoform X2 [Telopea speciosissima]|uniref:U11/U12 small nuclear ribonucleoprotein 59 kDa protein isoform X2 n=1 Tax=Telopea speciosissima TaxID=54955 RepID=UPI001CC3EC22|nr:U11/U12 small nuclear ribonucleoprotein 59 kDa protein isoform X2 [Telopea speciosissima]
MNPTPFSSGTPLPWFPISQPVSSVANAFWESGHVDEHLKNLQDTINLLKAVQKELEVIHLSRENNGSMEEFDNAPANDCLHRFLEVVKAKRINLKLQESLSLEAANSLLSKLKTHLEPFNALTNQTSSWEEKSAAVKVANKIQKHQRNKRWKKRKRKHIAEMLSKEREKFDQADQEADEWRAREIAKDIARRKVEKMKEIAKLKANEEKEMLESELELILIVEKLQELRSIRIQKLKKQGHFLPEEDDKFLQQVKAAVEEEERQAAAAADTDAARDAIATAEECRKTILNSGPESKDSSSKGGDNESRDQLSGTENERVAGAQEPEQGQEGQGSSGAYDSVSNLPVEFYHYYHGGNNDMGTLIKVRRTWDAYIRPGGRYLAIGFSHLLLQMRYGLPTWYGRVDILKTGFKQLRAWIRRYAMVAIDLKAVHGKARKAGEFGRVEPGGCIKNRGRHAQPNQL